jgi:Putative lumazine-binding
MSDVAMQITDEEVIRRTIQQYVDGGISGRGADMQPAFHDQATIFGYIGPDLFAGPIQGLFDWNDENGPATDLTAHIANIDIEGTVATARIELDNWTGHRFTDFFTLLKVDGEWKIMNKVFYLHPEA